jgi:hypothetical protein
VTRDGVDGVAEKINGEYNNSDLPAPTFALRQTDCGRGMNIPIAVLVGDTSANGSVNATDVSQTKAESGHALTAANFREDVSVKGSINSTDVGTVKAASRTALP